MKLKNSFHPYALVTIFFWSLSYVLTALALTHFSPFSLGFLRYLFASAALVVAAVFIKIKAPNKGDLWWFAAAGAAGFFLYMIAFNQGQGATTPATASVVMATVPVVTALLARFVYKEKLKAFQWVAIGVEFIGVALLTLMNGAFSVNKGLLWLFGAVLALSSYNLLQRKLTKNYSALQVSTYSIFFGTAMLAIFAPRAIPEAVCAPAVQFIYLAVLGICCSAIAYVSWAKAFSMAEKASQVSNYMFMIPFLATLMDFQIPDRATVIGGSIILLGVLIFNFGKKLEKK